MPLPPSLHAAAGGGTPNMALAMEAEEAVSLPVTYAWGQVVQVQGEDTSCESLRGHAQLGP